MSDSNPDNLSEIPEPSDTGITSVQQKNTQIILAVPTTSGGITTSPISQAFESLAVSNPQKLGSMPALIVGIVQENMQEKMRLEIKLNERETTISNQYREIADLKEKNAELRTELNAESRVKLLRSASITGGMLVLGFGFKLTEKSETLPYGVGLIVLGAVIAAFGWVSRVAKEFK